MIFNRQECKVSSTNIPGKYIVLSMLAVATMVVIGCEPGTPTPVAAPAATAVVATIPPAAPAIVTAIPPVVSSGIIVEVQSVSALPGETVIVQVVVNDAVSVSTANGNGVGSAQVRLTYDDSFLTALRATSNLTSALTNVRKSGSVILSSMVLTGDQLASGDPLISVSFEVSRNAPPGLILITLQDADLTDTAAPPQPIATVLLSGSINVQ